MTLEDGVILQIKTGPDFKLLEKASISDVKTQVENWEALVKSAKESANSAAIAAQLKKYGHESLPDGWEWTSADKADMDKAKESDAYTIQAQKDYDELVILQVKKAETKKSDADAAAKEIAVESPMDSIKKSVESAKSNLDEATKCYAEAKNKKLFYDGIHSLKICKAWDDTDGEVSVDEWKSTDGWAFEDEWNALKLSSASEEEWAALTKAVDDAKDKQKELIADSEAAVDTWQAEMEKSNESLDKARKTYDKCVKEHASEKSDKTKQDLDRALADVKSAEDIVKRATAEYDKLSSESKSAKSYDKFGQISCDTLRESAEDNFKKCEKDMAVASVALSEANESFSLANFEAQAITEQAERVSGSYAMATEKIEAYLSAKGTSVEVLPAADLLKISEGALSNIDTVWAACLSAAEKGLTVEYFESLNSATIDHFITQGYKVYSVANKVGATTRKIDGSITPIAIEDKDYAIEWTEAIQSYSSVVESKAK